MPFIVDVFHVKPWARKLNFDTSKTVISRTERTYFVIVTKEYCYGFKISSSVDSAVTTRPTLAPRSSKKSGENVGFEDLGCSSGVQGALKSIKMRVPVELIQRFTFFGNFQ